MISVPSIEPFFFRLADALDAMGAAAPIAYLGLAIVAAVVLAPGSFTKTLAGVLFGVGWGALWSFLGSYLGAIVAFSLARWGPRQWFEERLRQHPKAHAFERAISCDGFRMVMLLRLSPLVPYPLVNYGMGATHITFRDFALATPFMFPSVLLWAFVGASARETASVLLGSSERTLFEWGMWIVGAIATIALAWLVGEKAKRIYEGDGSAPEPEAEEK